MLRLNSDFMHKKVSTLLLLRNFFHSEKCKTLFFIIFFLTSIFVSAYSNIVPKDDTVVYRARTFNAEELIRGERLFFGLVYVNDKSINCASCHSTSVSDTLNWNPDALEISKKYIGKSAKELSRVLLSPSGIKMAQVHKGFQLTPEDIILIKAYMDRFVSIGLRQNKPVITNLFLFIIASILFLFSITDLIITKTVKKRWINYSILFVTTVL